jgi:Rrf2 family cysteine metabolism transcriptional repressor
MKLSTKARYTLRAMVDLATHYDQHPVPRKDIARRQGISPHYIEQLFTKVKQAGLIQAVRGPGGGYILAQSPEDIKVATVIEAVEEILGPVPCIRAESPMECDRAPTCVTRLLWREIGERTYNLLDSITLQDLCDQARGLDRSA